MDKFFMDMIFDKMGGDDLEYYAMENQNNSIFRYNVTNQKKYNYMDLKLDKKIETDIKNENTIVTMIHIPINKTVLLILQDINLSLHYYLDIKYINLLFDILKRSNNFTSYLSDLMNIQVRPDLYF